MTLNLLSASLSPFLSFIVALISSSCGDSYSDHGANAEEHASVKGGLSDHHAFLLQGHEAGFVHCAAVGNVSVD